MSYQFCVTQDICPIGTPMDVHSWRNVLSIVVKKLKIAFIVRHGNILTMVSFWTVVH